MKEGLFWVICNMFGGEIHWEKGWSLYSLFVKSDEISHKDAWKQVDNKELKKYVYSHYPRGRVVVRNGKVTIFLNQNIVKEEVIKEISNVFGLVEAKIHAEGGQHYKCYIDKF